MWNKPTESNRVSQPGGNSVSSSGTGKEAVNAPQETWSQPEPRAAAAMDELRGSRIGAGLKIHGEISGHSDLVIDGEAQGKIHIPDARITVGANGRVQADIAARQVTVNGTVRGSITASERVRLGATSNVQGTLTGPRLGIDDGARFRGKVEVIRPEPVVAAAADEPALETEALGTVTAGSNS